MPIISSHDQQHVTRMFLQEQRVNAIYNRLVHDVSVVLQRWKETGNKNVWVRNAEVERAIDKYLIEFKSVVENELKSGTLKAWNLSNDKNDKLVEQFIKNLSVSSIVKNGMMQRNMDAFETFSKRAVNGMNLSDRVWTLTGQTKENLELFLGSGIATGRSAEALGRDLRQLLYNPDARFRRIRNEKGELVPSAPMKNYNPGVGVYRSSRMNAIRLTGTETNMAYRTADHERWSRLDFVLGYEVHRSQNHKPCAVCDALKGKYPKDFIFQGWHPFCICYAVPLNMEPEDFADYLLTDEVPADKLIKDIPPSAHDFFDSNPNYKEKSYAGKVNKEWFEGKKEQRITLPEKFNERKLYDLVRTVEEDIRLNKDFETSVAFDSKGNAVLDKRGYSKSVEFSEFEKKKLKDTIFTHNHPGGWKKEEGTIGRIGASFSRQDITFAISNDVAEIRAVTPTYTFVLKRPEKGWGISYIDANNSYLSMESKVMSELSKIIEKSGYSDESMRRANILHNHLIMKRFAKKHHLEYGKSMSDVKNKNLSSTDITTFRHPISGKNVQLKINFETKLPVEVTNTKKQAREILQQLNDSEKAFVFTKDKKVYELFHEADNPFKIDLRNLKKEIYKDAYSIHNHPGGGTFSFEDVSAFIHYRMKSIEVVSDVNKTRYTLNWKGKIKEIDEKDFRLRWIDCFRKHQLFTRSKDIDYLNGLVLDELQKEFGFIYRVSNTSL